ncbi:MAG TPA: hypothetical protein VN328_06360, partial [Thermodesulfovibrionales bacterium]|nr:hypothetical protein [Thermodesulfovibrionales bacterium]
YQEFVTALIGEEYESPLKETVAASILGKPEYVEEIKEKYLEGKRTDRNVPALSALRRGPTCGEIWKVTEQALGDDHSLARKAALYISHRYSGRSLKEIGTEHGLSESGVSQASGRFARLLDDNRILGKKVQAIMERLGLSNG